VHFKSEKEGAKHLGVLRRPRVKISHMMQYKCLGDVHLSPCEFFIREGQLRGSSNIDWAEGYSVFDFGQGKSVLGGSVVETESILAAFFGKIP
jgi:hypothetical protein